MNEAIRFLQAVAKQLSVARLYHEGHPEREQSLDSAYQCLRILLEVNPQPVFTFLEGDVVYNDRPVSELRQWEWAGRLAGIEVERLEIEASVTIGELRAFLEEANARLAMGLNQDLPREPSLDSAVRYGPVSVLGEKQHRTLPEATMGLNLEDELEVAAFLHAHADAHGEIPRAEAIGVVQLLSAAMHSEEEIILPLVELKEVDQYSATHSVNVSVLSMGLAESIALASADVRAVGEAALLHDVGKTVIPLEILNKPGKLTTEEWQTIQQHPVEGARILLASGPRFAQAATAAYEHHIAWTGDKGYPALHYARQPQRLSRLIQVCDVYDALRTRRPFRPPWPVARTLHHLQEEMGEYLDPEFVTAFLSMIRQWEPLVLKQSEPDGQPSEPVPAGAANG
jgi:putative nucleotidyltransferase with HDIG domain